MEKEINESKVVKNTESVTKDGFGRIVEIKEEASTVVKEEEE